MRQTGKTTRIVNHVVEQLFSVGRCIATDHTAYEYNIKKESLGYFIDRVKTQVKLVNYSTTWNIEHTFVQVEGVFMVDFRLTKQNTYTSNKFINDDDIPF